MPSYRIHHLTRYTYEELVPVCHNLAHLRPRQSPRHRWTSAAIDIHPTPATRAERSDYFGNILTFFAIQEPHRELSVTTDSHVHITPPESAIAAHSPLSWEQVRDSFSAPSRHFKNAATLDALQFTFASPCVRWTPAVYEYARPSFPEGRPIVEAVLDLTKRVHKDFTYDVKSTTVSTTLPEIMKARSGVCQDFAHLQIGCLRSMGLAARYVSGYLLTTPPPGAPRLVGADASHAWLSVYLPHAHGGGGVWLDLDPTNNIIPGDKHITIAWGRDFGDVSPLRGVIFGGRDHTVHVSVDVTPIA